MDTKSLHKKTVSLLYMFQNEQSINKVWINSFLFCAALYLSLSPLDYSEHLCDCDHACGGCIPLVWPAATLLLPRTGPIRLAVRLAEPKIWLPAGRHNGRGMSRWVWLPALLPSRHVLWWAGPNSHANHPLPHEILVPPKQCHHSCVWLSSSKCNQSGVAHDALQSTDIWRHWQEGKLTVHLVLVRSSHTRSEHDTRILV